MSMAEIAELAQARKERARVQGSLLCGSCMTTGLQHEWNAEASLVPVVPARACSHCGGKGWIEERK